MPHTAAAESLLPVLLRPSPPLGFGTGLLYRIRDGKSAVRLIETAFDCGIVYFDTARLYSDGRSEGMLGEAFSRRRDQVILVSKAGILPSSRTLAKRVVDKAVTTARKAPFLRGLLREPKYAEPTFGVFDVPSLRKSVDTSLRELRTDYLDALLLHECTAENAADPELKEFCEELVKKGQIRAYGVAPRVEDALAIERQGLAFGSIMQIASNAWDDNVAHLASCGGRLVVTHSILTDRFRDAIERLRRNEAAAARWRAAFDTDPNDMAAMARLFLSHALSRNPSGVVLFSTTRAERIRENLRALDSPLAAAQADLLAEMLRTL